MLQSMGSQRVRQKWVTEPLNIAAQTVKNISVLIKQLVEEMERK